MTKFEQFINQKIAEYGEKFDRSNLNSDFVAAFNSGARIKVSQWDMTCFGTVGVTTGWRPVFLLMHNSRSIGSSNTIGPEAKIVAVKSGRKYKEAQ